MMALTKGPTDSYDESKPGRGKVPCCRILFFHNYQARKADQTSLQLLDALQIVKVTLRMISLYPRLKK